jgi:hypothetical protein
MDVFLLWSDLSMLRADHSFRGVLPAVVCHCVT